MAITIKKSIIKSICNQVKIITERCGTRDPAKICHQLRISIYYHDLGNKLKGYYVYKFGIHNIVIDSNLDEQYIMIILAHELGHFALHSQQLMTYHEIGIGDSLDSLEVQAHFFCAELLIQDQDAISALEEFGSIEAAAKELMVPPDLIDYKLQIMECKNLLTIKDLNYANRNFLKTM